MLIAVFLNEITCKWFKKSFQSFIFLPYFISWVVAAAIVQALPQARQDSAIAGAYWARTDGSHRFLLRITTEELKNYGAVYNVISAAMTAAPKSRKKSFQKRDNKRK